jgi:hypothetical protein
VIRNDGLSTLPFMETVDAGVTYADFWNQIVATATPKGREGCVLDALERARRRSSREYIALARHALIAMQTQQCFDASTPTFRVAVRRHATRTCAMRSMIVRRLQRRVARHLYRPRSVRGLRALSAPPIAMNKFVRDTSAD